MFRIHPWDRKNFGLAAVAIFAALFGCGLGTPTAAEAQAVDPATLLYVKNMGVVYINVGGPKRQPIAVVDIVDGNGVPVNGAKVVGNWSGCFKEIGDSSLTQTYSWVDNGTIISVDGRSKIYSQRTFSCLGAKTQCNFTFTITGVILNGMTYVPVIGWGTSWAETPCH